MNKKLALSIVIAVFLLAGCAASGPKLASSAEDIAGTWQSTITSAEFRINEDGTYHSQREAGDTADFEFCFEGTRITIRVDSCQNLGEPIVGIFEVELLENGNLKFIAIEADDLGALNFFAGRLVEVEWEPVP